MAKPGYILIAFVVENVLSDTSKPILGLDKLSLCRKAIGGVPRSGEGVDKLFVCVVSLSYQFLSTPSVTSFLVPLYQWDSLLARYSINFQSQANSN